MGSAASEGRGDGGGGGSSGRRGGAVGLGGASAERNGGRAAAVWSQFLAAIYLTAGNIPGVADGDGGGQQRAGHGVRAGESDGTGLFNISISSITTPKVL